MRLTPPDADTPPDVAAGARSRFETVWTLVRTRSPDEAGTGFDRVAFFFARAFFFAGLATDFRAALRVVFRAVLFFEGFFLAAFFLLFLADFLAAFFAGFRADFFAVFRAFLRAAMWCFSRRQV